MGRFTLPTLRQPLHQEASNVQQFVVTDCGYTDAYLSVTGTVDEQNINEPWSEYLSSISQVNVGNNGYTLYLLETDGSLYAANYSQSFHQEASSVQQFVVADCGYTEYICRSGKVTFRTSTILGPATGPLQVRSRLAITAIPCTC